MFLIVITVLPLTQVGRFRQKVTRTINVSTSERIKKNCNQTWKVNKKTRSLAWGVFDDRAKRGGLCILTGPRYSPPQRPSPVTWVCGGMLTCLSFVLASLSGTNGASLLPAACANKTSLFYPKPPRPLPALVCTERHQSLIFGSSWYELPT